MKGEILQEPWDNPPAGGDISTEAAILGPASRAGPEMQNRLAISSPARLAGPTCRDFACAGAAMPELDAQLLAVLIERHAAALKLYARQWCIAPDDAVQQAFIDLAASRDCPANPAAWLFTAVRNRAISAGRSDRRRAKHEAAGARQWFERRNDRDEAAEAAAEVLQELPLMEREIVIAHLWGRLTFAEIAQLTNTSSSTAQRRYEAAIDRMKEKLKPTSNEEIQSSINLKSEP